MTKSILEIDQIGNKRWSFNHQLHREDGPAVELLDGTKLWWLNGQLHREDGPAIEYPNGSTSWYLNNHLIAKEERPNNWEELVLLARVKQIMTS